MNASLEQSIIERLHDLDDARLAEVFDFVEFLRSRPPRPLQAMSGLLSATATGTGEEVMEVLQEMKAERAASVEYSATVPTGWLSEVNPSFRS